MARFKEYDHYDAMGLAELVHRGEMTPAELVEEAIARIEEVNPKINAVIHPMYDIAREAARRPLPDGPFAGVPFLLKDLLAAYAGVPMRCGSRFLRDFVPQHDSEIVRRYKSAGVLFLGKTNAPEYGIMPYTEPELFGPTNNPWDVTRTAGGSSGGSAAAVAARVVPMAHGNDGGGSIRIPAACCGVFGFKPTRARTPIGPAIAEAWHGLSIDHVLTLSVRDSAAMLDATAGPDVGAPYVAPPPGGSYLEEVGRDPGKLRVAFTTKPLLPATIHPDCVRGVEQTAALLEELGHQIEEDAPAIDGEAFARAFLTMVCGETRAEIEDLEELTGRRATPPDFEASTWALGMLGRHIPAVDFSRAVRLLKNTGRRVGAFFERYDVLLTPTLSQPPFITGSLQPKGAERRAMEILCRLNAGFLLNALVSVDALAADVFAFIPFTPVFNATGQPAMSVPLVWNDEGLPIGMHFVGRFGDEATLFRLAGQLEKARPWFLRRPPVCAGGEG